MPRALEAPFLARRAERSLVFSPVQFSFLLYMNVDSPVRYSLFTLLSLSMLAYYFVFISVALSSFLSFFLSFFIARALCLSFCGACCSCVCASCSSKDGRCNAKLKLKARAVEARGRVDFLMELNYTAG